MQVKRVDEVVLEDVDEVEADELVALDLDRPLGVREADRVRGIELVCAVEVRVEAVHDHDELVGVLARVLRIDDERAVEALGDVLGERAHVAVVEVQPVRQRVELVDRRPAWRDLPGTKPEDAVGGRRVDAVEVHRVRVVAAVEEANPQPVALLRAQRRARDAAVVRPGHEPDAGRELDLMLGGGERPLA